MIGELDHPTAALASALAAGGVRTVFRVASRMNAQLAMALAGHQLDSVTARDEQSAAVMAGAYARIGGNLAALTLDHEGGLAAALPGLFEAVRNRTPLLVIASHGPDAGLSLAESSLLKAVGALVADVGRPDQAVKLVTEASRAARACRRPVVLRVRTDNHDGPHRQVPEFDSPSVPLADAAAVKDLAELLMSARRPVFIAGRGAVHAAQTLARLADHAGALLATSVAAHGLYGGDAWNLGVTGVLATPGAADLMAAADVVIGWGCALDDWTTWHGSLIAPEARVAQIDINPAALGAHRRIDLGIAGDAGWTAEVVRQALPQRRIGYRTRLVRQRIAELSRWSDVGYEPVLEQGDRIDPRTLTLVLDAILPAERTSTVEPGAAIGYPVSYLRVPDAQGFCLAPACGLGLASGIGAALARPDRLSVISLDADGVLAATADLETAAGLRARLLIVVYDEDGESDPAVDLPRIAQGYGCDSAVVRRPADLTAVSEWLAGPAERPLLLHAKIARCSWWLTPRDVQVQGEAR
ncbi:thiamine pyrophosphate-binding protein [Nonomuraea fuscirosea]|uniref:thiamine pyrophosphate-binding protein n=1 Tax=Nonomuraea fuscirosea TaxID=1291556 RepID=UPI0033D0F218